mmetsp:Transcript_46950/g.47406  ORF Transcript_46950/g.47406 Transcript_46950/m.47406 type:complete len:99 (-) Transcript_46950:315-611(-)
MDANPSVTTIQLKSASAITPHTCRQRQLHPISPSTVTNLVCASSWNRGKICETASSHPLGTWPPNVWQELENQERRGLPKFAQKELTTALAAFPRDAI